MGKGELMLYVIFPILFTLGVYGIFIAARLKKTGWDIKSMVMVACITLPLIGFIIAVIIRAKRNKGLKKEEVESQHSSGNAGDLSHSWYYISRKEFKIIILSFFIAQAVYVFMFFAVMFHTEQRIKKFTKEQSIESLLQDTAFLKQMLKDSTIKSRGDSMAYKSFVSIIQGKIDSLKNRQVKNPD